MLIGPISLTYSCSYCYYRCQIVVRFAAERMVSLHCDVERAYWPLFIFQCFTFGCYLNFLFANAFVCERVAVDHVVITQRM